MTKVLGRGRRLGGRSRVDGLIVALLTGAFLLLGLMFALLIPMFGNFDEQSHLDRARFTARHPWEHVGPELRITHGSEAAVEAVWGGPFPLGADGPQRRAGYRPFRDYDGGNRPDDGPCILVCQNYQYAHPPAWYVAAAPITAALEGQTFPRQVLAVRIFNLVLAAPLVFLAWDTARSVWPAARRRPLAAAALMAFASPMAYTASAVNNDGLLLPVTAACIAIAARMLRRGPTLHTAGGLGMALGIGLLTKVNMVLIAPALGLVVLTGAVSLRQRVRLVAAFVLPVLPGALWWLDALRAEGPLSPASSELSQVSVPGPWKDATLLTFSLERLPTLLGRFWGTYNQPVSFLPIGVQWACTLGAVALGVGWAASCSCRRPARQDLRWLLLPAIPVSLVVGVLFASFSAYRRNGFLLGLTPRYVYPSMALLAIGAVAAARVIARRHVPWRLEPRLLPLGTAVAAALGGFASAAWAIRAAYPGASWLDLRSRAAAVGPIGRPTPVVVLVAFAWAAAVAAVVMLMARIPSSVTDAPEAVEDPPPS